ncbi:MAG TPA: response regulator transcription factor [Chitinophagaceae bacterium]|nr:response regulator transcription factor [Chitinophagaceae bacterium]
MEAIDYLVKPITFDRFLNAVEHIHAKKSQFPETEPATLQQRADYLFIKHASKLVKVRFGDILYLEAQKDFVKFVTGNEELLAEELLPDISFLRVHRSYIVSIDAITAIFGNIIEIGSCQIPIGANYKETVMATIR